MRRRPEEHLYAHQAGRSPFRASISGTWRTMRPLRFFEQTLENLKQVYRVSPVAIVP